jgi:hypothetical protein
VTLFAIIPLSVCVSLPATWNFFGICLKVVDEYMRALADELHNTRVILVVIYYLLYHISTCSLGVAGGVSA